LTTIDNDNEATGWGGVCLYVTGAATTAVLNVSVVMHVEVQVDPDGGVPATQHRNPPEIIEKVIKKTKSVIGEGTYKKAEKGVWDWVVKTGEKFIGRGVEFVGDLLFGGQGTTINNYGVPTMSDPTFQF
jgi:hypothetical protein